ncbi:MAG: Ig-like domain-containing protein, partial [Desulfuromonadaceae bacterium]
TPVIAKINGNTYDGTNAWTASSATYNSIPMAQSDIAAVADAPLVDKTTGYKNWNVTNIVKGWVATPGSNRGLLLNSSNKASSDSNRTFASSEVADANQRPKLVVTYTLASDTTAPVAAITSPTANATVSGTVNVTASASDSVGVSKVEFYVNGALKATDTASPYSYSWDSKSVSNGSYSITSKAYDAAGNVGQSSAVSVSVNNVVADTTAPVTAITSPAANATVSGTVTISASASDSVGVSKVEFYVNGALKATDTASPFSYSWNTTTGANGSYSITTKAYDAAGNVGQSAAVTAVVSNTVTPPPAGTVTAVFGNTTGATYPNTVEDTFLKINNEVNATSTTLATYTWPAAKPANAILMNWNLSTLPANAQIQSATLSLYMTGSGGDAQYEIPVSGIVNKTPVIAKINGNTYDGTNAWTASSATYNSIPMAQSDIAAVADAPLVDKTTGYKNWNVTNIVKGWVATPGSNRGLLLNSSNKASSDSNRTFASSEVADANQRPKLVVTYTLASDTTAPVAAITSPTANATVSGTVNVTASASDSVGVSKVEFYVNGALKATDTASPYSYSWDSKSVSNGSYSITSKAYDAAGNVGQSSAVSVSVNNVVADTTAPSVAITSPAANATIKGTICAAVSASDNVGVTKVEYYVGGSLNNTVTASPFGFCVTTTAEYNGTYTMYAKAYDAAGNVTQSKSVNYTIKN